MTNQTYTGGHYSNYWTFDKTLKEILDTYVEKGLISRRENKELFIYSYTNEVQYKRLWDEYTKMARGLILDREGNIVARPFRKFFNFNEIDETALTNLPDEKPEVSDKLDGSLGIMYKQDDKYKIATRGSFDSDQANVANDILKTKYNKVNLDSYSDYTFLFEIVYPENRVVIDYGEVRDIFLVGMVHIKKGNELSYTAIKYIANELGLKVVNSETKSFDEIYGDIKKNKVNSEGYVLRYSNGLRMKIKTEDYVRLHKLLTGLSEKDVWEILKNSDDKSKFLENVPDEFHKWFDETYIALQLQYDFIEKRAKDIFDETLKFKTRKEYALHFKNKTANLNICDRMPLGVLFKMLDREDYSDIIWKSIKPSGSRGFKMVKEK